jgi:glutamine cyclotransferase
VGRVAKSQGRNVAVSSPARRRWPIILVMTAFLLAMAFYWFNHRPAPAAERESPEQMAAAAPSADAPQRLKLKVVSVRPHDPGAFTQGLVWHDGTLFESTGLYGSSSLREVDPQTGKVKRSRVVPKEDFAEGLALVDDRLIQLTWKEQRALVYKQADFTPAGDLRYDGEGWGLCYDGRRLVMSNGSDRLFFRDPKTFALLGDVQVTLAGKPVWSLNELECVDGVVYANVWQEDDIVRIDPATGKVSAVIDASGLLTPEERRQTDVLNGIAWDPTAKTFLITGKMWPKMFEVKFEP